MTTLSKQLQGWTIPITGAAWALIYFLSRGLLENIDLAPWLRVVIALLPILPFAVFFWIANREIRQMDELHLRVHLEALATAFPLAIVFLMMLGLLGQALDLSYERHVWHYLPMFYFLGLAIAWKRYQ
jgi:hypothetical protein